MKTSHIPILALVLTAVACGGSPRVEPAGPTGAKTSDAGPPALAPIAFEVGNHGFADGDEIVVTSLSGDRPTVEAGGHCHVEGTWKLASHAVATIGLYVMNGEASGANTIRVRAGEGRFSFDATITKAGFPHVSFYPDPGGTSFGGTFFGVGSLVYHGSYLPGPVSP
jgi:hypothetical protein